MQMPLMTYRRCAVFADSGIMYIMRFIMCEAQRGL